MKITDMQAACGLAQLNKLDNFIKKRKINFSFLKKNLENLQENLILPKEENGSEPSWFGFPITLSKSCKVKRKDIIAKLYEKKIGTRLLFSGNLTKQPAYINKNFKISGKLSNTDYIMENTFWIGVFPGLDEEELSYVVKIIKSCF